MARGLTCWRRLRDWHEAGGWDRRHQVLLQRLADADQLDDWSRACLGLVFDPSAKRGEKTGPSPADGGRAGTKRHVVVERGGRPLAAVLSAANVHDSRMLEGALDAVLPVAGPRGRPRRRPKKLHADKGYDFARCRAALRRRGITPRIARRGQDGSQHLGRHRWVVEAHARLAGPLSASARYATNGALTSTKPS